MSIVENSSNQGLGRHPVTEILSITSGVTGTTLSLENKDFDKIPNLIKLTTGLTGTFSTEMELTPELMREFHTAVYDNWAGLGAPTFTAGISKTGNIASMSGDGLTFSINEMFLIGSPYYKAKEIHVSDVDADFVQSKNISVENLSIENSSYGDFQTYSMSNYQLITNGPGKPIDGCPTQWIEVNVAGIKRRIPSW